MVIKQVRKIGGSYFCIIPAQFISALKLSVGDYLKIELVDKTLVFNKVDLKSNLVSSSAKKEGDRG